MKILCKELKQEFETKQEMFKALKENKDKIIGLKKAAIKFSDPVSIHLRSEGEAKAENDTSVDIGSTVYAVINSCNFLDSHSDVHIPGLWDVSLKDQKYKLYYIINHELELGKVISYPEDTEPYVLDTEWSKIGLSYTGKTQLLVYKVLLTEATNKDALMAIKSKKAIQNSVRMQYVSMTLCIDDSSEDFAAEYANFYKYLPQIANKQKALDQGYFWAITEAKVYKEGSAVLFGSNEATPILYSDPESTSQNDESQKENNPENTSCSLELIKTFKFLN